MGSAALDSARAQNVVNGNFALPSAANAPGGDLVDPPTSPQIGWTFSSGGAHNISGVQQNGSSFGGPAAPNGDQQTAFIRDLATISQNIDFKKPGDYTVSFQLAAVLPGAVPANTTQAVTVSVAGHQVGGVYLPPGSGASFNQLTTPFFTIPQANPSVELKFAGYGLAGGQLTTDEKTTVFLANVTINPLVPQITTSTCPTDIDPTSTIKLSGANFGSVPGQILIHFPSASKVKFKNSNAKDLYLDVPAGQWGGTITSEALDKASPLGAPPAQTVDLYVVAANGSRSSNACHPKFNDKPVITGVSPGSITPSHGTTVSSFNVKGWDFGGDTGKATIHFTNNQYHAGPPIGSNDDVDAPINKGTNGKDEWQPWVVHAIVPAIVGVIEQDVDISVARKDGSASNSWKEQFEPFMQLMFMLTKDVIVLSCSNGGEGNACDYTSDNGIGCVVGNLDALGTGAVLIFGVAGAHVGCWSSSSDDGTDQYFAEVKNAASKIVQIDPYAPSTDNGSVEYASNGVAITGDYNTVPSISVPLTVNWHIGATGGLVGYSADFVVKGPAGVPYDEP